MKVKIILFCLMSLQQVYSQLRHPWELRMTTENGPDEITFHINSTGEFIWEAHFHDNNYTYLTIERRYVDPDDITMPGNYIGSGFG